MKFLCPNCRRQTELSDIDEIAEETIEFTCVHCKTNWSVSIEFQEPIRDVLKREDALVQAWRAEKVN